MASFFEHPEAKQRILQLYDSKLEELAISYEMQKIETSFGNTNIILTGPVDAPPLVLLHGSNGCAPVALEAMQGLINDFRIYAIDVVGQPNLSAEVRPDMKGNAYGQWMFEILTRLNIWKAILIGISFGGFISWKTLVFDDKRIKRAFFLMPAGIVNGSAWQLLTKVFLQMKLYRWRKKEKYLLRFLNDVFTEKDSFALQFLSTLFLRYKMDFSPIPLIKEIEAKKIKTPLHFISADQDLLFPGEKMQQRTKNIFPTIQKGLLLENTKHVPDVAGNQKIVDFIKTYA